MLGQVWGPRRRDRPAFAREDLLYASNQKSRPGDVGILLPAEWYVRHEADNGRMRDTERMEWQSVQSMHA
eukprot:scaffold248529_cov33-Tisochrysis_lutea.AAC.3